jgi:hypothetical protein
MIVTPGFDAATCPPAPALVHRASANAGRRR